MSRGELEGRREVRGGSLASRAGLRTTKFWPRSAKSGRKCLNCVLYMSLTQTGQPAPAICRSRCWRRFVLPAPVLAATRRPAAKD